jgi:GNAT superfamily N-acetyltransferase
MDTEKCVIQEARDADLARLVQLYRAFLEEAMWGASHVTPNPRFDVERVLRRRLHGRNSAILAAELDGEIVGFACVEFRPSTDGPLDLWGRVGEFFTHRRARLAALFPAHGYLAHLFVEGRARRKGIGSALILASCDWVKRRGAKAFELNVLAENHPARRLYRKLAMSELLVHYRMEF